MNTINALHLVNEFGEDVEKAVHLRMERLGLSNFRWHIAALYGGSEASQRGYERLGMQVLDLSNSKERRGSRAGRLRRYVKEHGVRIVHAHSARTVLVGATALVGLRDTRLLATEHHWYVPSDRAWGWIYTLVDRFSLYLPDRVVAVSRKMHSQITRLPLIRPRRVTAIQNAINCESFYLPEQREACRREWGIAPDAPVIGFAGRLVRLKKVDLLLRAFARVRKAHPEARLMIVGGDDPREGRQEGYLRSLAHALDIESAIVWTGFRGDVPRLLAAMDIYVQASTNEGLSYSILEAMAAGKAVVTTNVGGAGEVVTHGETALLIAPESVAEIENALADLLDHPEKRAAMGDAARRHVLSEFNLARTNEAYRELYEELGRAAVGAAPATVSEVEIPGQPSQGGVKREAV